MNAIYRVRLQFEVKNSAAFSIYRPRSVCKYLVSAYYIIGFGERNNIIGNACNFLFCEMCKGRIVFQMNRPVVDGQDAISVRHHGHHMDSKYGRPNAGISSLGRIWVKLQLFYIYPFSSIIASRSSI